MNDIESDFVYGLTVEQRKIYQKLKTERELVVLNLCEQEHLVLKPNQLYVFKVDAKCPKCVALSKID